MFKSSVESLPKASFLGLEEHISPLEDNLQSKFVFGKFSVLLKEKEITIRHNTLLVNRGHVT